MFCFFVSSGSAGYQYSTNTFLYSLKNYRAYGYFKKDITHDYHTATYSYYSYFPTFGHHDIYIADNAAYNTNSYISVCQAYRGSYCDNSLWVGTRYGNNFCPDELEVYYEVLTWNWASHITKGKQKKKQNNNNTSHIKNINKPTKISSSKKWINK